MSEQDDGQTYTSADMWQAWSAGYAFCADRIEIFYDERYSEVPDLDEDDFGSWIEDYDAELVEGS